jgi:hypothetical protein
MTRREPAPDPELPDTPAAPADVPDRTAPPSRSALGTSETQEPVEGVHAPDGDLPT